MLVEIKKINGYEIPTVSSLDVADEFTYTDEETNKKYVREHKAILRSIREMKCSEEFRGENFAPSEYIDSRGKKQPCIIMTKDGFTLLAMGFNDPKAIKAKEKYIKQFNAMRKTLTGKHIEREKGIAVRQALTKALQQSTENDRMHGHAYSTYTNCIYKALFNKNAKQLREEYGLDKKSNLRDCFNEEQLKAIKSMEMLVSGLVDCGWDYDKIKSFIMQTNTKQIAN